MVRDMTSQEAGGQAIFELKCVFSLFEGKKAENVVSNV